MSKNPLPEGKETPENKEQLAIDIDQLMHFCGNATDNPENNGYGCMHPDSPERTCLMHQCPIAWSADYRDLVEVDRTLAREYKSDQNGSISSDLMILIRKMMPELYDQIIKMRNQRGERTKCE